MPEPVDPVIRNLFFTTLAVGVIPPFLVGSFFSARVIGYSPSGYLAFVALLGMIPMSLSILRVLSMRQKRSNNEVPGLIGSALALSILNMYFASILELDMISGDPSSTGGLIIPVMVGLGFIAVAMGWQAGRLVGRVIQKGG